MRRMTVLTIAGAMAFAGVASTADAAERPWVDQSGTYTALAGGDYTGRAPITQASEGRTLGLGTFGDLDGELVLVGGTVFQVGTDGRPVPAAPTRTTPFLEAIRFAPDASVPVAPGTRCADLGKAVDAAAGGDTGMVAVRVRGTFTDLVTRSVPAQQPPYRPLAEVIAEQVVFPLGERRAVLVGFRTGPDLAGSGAPGLHLHGLTVDRSAGGHVLSCVAGGDVQLSIQRTSGVRLLADPT